jgi:hypothetical protein
VLKSACDAPDDQKQQQQFLVLNGLPAAPQQGQVRCRGGGGAQEVRVSSHLFKFTGPEEG